MSDEIKVLFGNIMQPFKSAFGTEEKKKDEKKEYGIVSLVIMYIVFIASFLIPLVYLFVYLPYYAAKKVSSTEVIAAMKSMKGDGIIYIGLVAFAIFFGLIGLIVTAATTKTKDDSKGDKATFTSEGASMKEKAKRKWAERKAKKDEKA